MPWSHLCSYMRLRHYLVKDPTQVSTKIMPAYRCNSPVSQWCSRNHLVVGLQSKFNLKKKCWWHRMGSLSHSETKMMLFCSSRLYTDFLPAQFSLAIFLWPLSSNRCWTYAHWLFCINSGTKKKKKNVSEMLKPVHHPTPTTMASSKLWTFTQTLGLNLYDLKHWLIR